MEQTSFIQLNKPYSSDLANSDKFWKENPDKIDNKFREVSDSIGDLSNLSTTNQSSLTSAVNETVAQLAEMSTFTNKRKIPLSTPTNYNWTNHPLVDKIFSDGNDHFWVENFDISNYQHVGAGKVYYVDTTNGSDTNDGLSLATALKTLNVAYAKPDIDIMVVAEGMYRESLAVAKNISIKAISGHKVIISVHEDITWTKTSGFTNLYHVNKGSGYVGAVLDTKFKDDFGNYKKLTKVSTQAIADSTPGTYYNSSTNLFVHTFDSRIPDSQVIIPPKSTLPNMALSGANNFYLEGIEVWGGDDACVSATGGNVYTKNCKFKYGARGLRGNGALLLYSQGTEAAHNGGDGLTYSGSGAKIIEIDCVGRDNGTSGDLDNGSTIHTGVSAIRINGAYYRNVGSNVGDISTGTQSWNMGCIAFESKAVTINDNKTNFNAHGDGEMWLDGCVSYGSLNAITVEANGKMHLRNPKLQGSQNVLAGGLLDTY